MESLPMSRELSPSRNITDGATALELALGQILAGLRVDCDRAVAAFDADRRAARAELEMVLQDIKTIRAEFALVLEAIKQQRIEARGERGEPGAAGAAGVPGDPGPPGEPGIDGRDGRDGLPGVPGERGRDGKDGANGKDGLGVGDFDVEYDGERTIKLRWKNGEREVERSFTMANMLYRGVWESGRTYEAQDVVSFGGSGFVALKKTKNKPEGDDWQLFVKRGLPGSSGKAGERGAQGPAGRDGRDLTQIGIDGRKWG